MFRQGNTTRDPVGMRSVRFWLGRLLASLMLVAIGIVMVPADPGFAAGDDYPTSIAGCKSASNASQPRFTCDLRNPAPDTLIDPWDFYNRQCTSFVAWRLNQGGYGFTNNMNSGHWGHAHQWDENAAFLHYAIDQSPMVGDIAHWNAGEAGTNFTAHGSGHVAYVTSVATDGSVSIEDYNGTGGEFVHGTRSGVRAPRYIHIRPRPGGWWLGPTPSDGAAVLFTGQAVAVNVHAQDNTGSGLARVEITWFLPGRSTHWSKSTNWLFGASQADYRAYIPYSFGSPNELIISFDVYANNGTYRLAPQGMRRLCKVGTQCDPVSVRPPVLLDPPGGGGGGGGSGPPSPGCVPGQNQAAVFADANYQGSCMVKGLGEYSSPESIGLANDSISSIKVGGGANVRLCDNAGLNSPCEYFNSDDSDLSNNMIGTNTVSSMKVEDGAPTTGCAPGDSQVAFYMNENYQGTCILKGVGRYEDPNAINLPNDSISSIRVGNRVRVRACDNAGVNSPCEEFVGDDDNLSNNSIGTNTISSAEVTLRGGIALCDGTNYGGQCKWFGTGKYNMQENGFNDVAESVRYDDGYGNLYHIVLWSERDQTGNPAHYDNSVPDIGPAFRNRVRSIEIYKHTPPGASAAAPVNGAVFPTNTTTVDLTYDGGSERRVHVWGTSYDLIQDWTTAKTLHLTALSPGSYSWQVQARSAPGEGAWTAIQTFRINKPPVVGGGSLAMNAATSQSIQIQAFDAEASPLTLTAAGLPAFATFTDNTNGAGTLTLNPNSSQTGDYTITISASDGDATASANITVTVQPAGPSSGYQAEYFNNRELSGAPVLTRSENTIDNDWGGGSPDPAVSHDNFSARWSKTVHFEAGTYRFSATGDDGLRLFLDGQLVLNRWIDQGPTTYTIDRTVATGQLTLKYEYYEAGGGAVAKLSYSAVSPEVYSAQYFNNREFAGLPVAARTDVDIDFNWGDGAPHELLDPNNFAARWSKTTHLDAGRYTFMATADDGVRLYIDGERVIDKWFGQPATSYTVSRDLTAGDHTIAMEYYESGGGAVAGLRYVKHQAADYLAEYYDNRDLWGTPRIIRGETTIDHDWGGSSPNSILPADNFTARWTKTVELVAGTYRFTARGDDGLRLFVDGQRVIDAWVDQSATTYTANVTLSAGPHTIVYEYYEAGGGALAQLSYQQQTGSPNGIELLPSTWHLSGNAGASELYQSIDPNILSGKTMLRITYDLHGINALGGDASAIIFDQGGWKFISLSGYGQNGYNGTQTVEIPLTAFGLNTSQPVGTLHTRFWYHTTFTIDITSIQLY